MATQQKTSSTYDRPSFLGLPPGLRFLSWSMFWGGVLVGVAIGVVVCLLLVELQVITPRPGEWTPEVTLPMILLLAIGVNIAARAVRRSQQTDHDKS